MDEEDLTVGEKVETVFERVSALKTNGHFVLTSIQDDSPYPHHSDVYVEKRELLSRPVEVLDIASAIVDDHREWHKNVDVVLSPAVGGIVLGSFLALELTTRFDYLDFRDHPVKIGSVFDSLVFPGSQVLVAEDVTTSGETVKKIIEEVLKRGAHVKAAVILFQRQPIDLGKITKVALITKKLRDWKAEVCQPCRNGILPDLNIGHGRKFLAEFGKDPANWPANRK